MNKIYKVVWSKVRNCYVVACELAKCHNKGNGTRTIRIKAARVLSVLLVSAYLVVGYGVQAAWADSSNQFINITDKTIAVGSGADAGAGFTPPAEFTIAIGNNAAASAQYSVAIGVNAAASAQYSVAIGNNAAASTQYSFAIGNNATSTGEYGTAFGNNASVTVDRGIALGSASVADRQSGVQRKVSGYDPATNKASTFETIAWRSTAGALSIGDLTGSTQITRQITGVAAGSEDTDAVNVAQLKAAMNAGGGGAAYTAGNGIAIANNAISVKNGSGLAFDSDGKLQVNNGNGLAIDTDGRLQLNPGSGLAFGADGKLQVNTGSDLTFDTDGKLQVTKNGAVAANNTGIVNGGTVYSELRPANGNYVQQGNSTAANLTALDTQVKKNTDTANDSVKSLSVSGQTITYTKNDGTTGTITTQDNDTQYTAGNGLALNGTAFSAKAGTNVTVDGNGINVAGNGTIASGNTGLVSGGTAYTELRPADGTFVKQASTTAQNLAALDSSLKTTAEGLATESANRINEDTALSNRIGTLNANGNYITATNSAAQNLSVLDTQVKTNAEAIGNLGNSKANISLNNITDDGKTVVRNLAKESVKVIEGTNTTVTTGTAGTATTYAVNVTANGQVTDGNTGIVNGGTVYSALNNGLNGKANADASNVGKNATTDNSAAWGTALGTGAVAENNGKLVTGDTVFAAIKTAKDEVKAATDTKLEGYAKIDGSNVTTPATWGEKLGTGEVKENNGELVTGDTVYDALKDATDKINTDLSGKANVNASNVGNNVNDGGTNLRAWNDALKANDVTDNGVGFITSAQLFTEARPADGTYVKNANSTAANLTTLDKQVKANVDAIAGKANTSLDNITTAGETVIRELAKGSVKVINGEHTTVTEGTDGDAKTYKVNTVVNGKVEANDKGIVDGGTVYTALQNAKDDIADALEEKADTDLGNLTQEGKNVITGIAKESVKVTGTGIAHVTSTETASTVTYNVDVKANGKIEKGDINAVSGDTVYNAIGTISDDLNGKIGGKANTDLSNITDAGKNAIRDAVKPDLDKKANVDASNIQVNAWAEKLGVGEVEAGNTGLVNGNTVYKALEKASGSDLIGKDTETGAIRIGALDKYDNMDFVDISKSTGEGRVFTGVITDPGDLYSAANVSYVNAVGEGIINGVNRGFDRMNTKINKVGAGAAALAALHPMEMDNKFGMGIGYGNYRNANAMALGVFYRPQDNLMFSVGGSMGNSENMINAGISIALDKGVSNSKAVMARKIQYLEEQNEAIRSENAAIKEQNMKLEARLAAIEAKLGK